MLQEARLCVLALAAFARDLPARPSTPTRAGRAAPSERAPPLADDLGLPIVRRFDVRPALGAAAVRGRATTRDHRRLAALRRAARRSTPSRCAMFADAWMPVAVGRACAEPVAAPTIDLTIHFRAAARRRGGRAGARPCFTSSAPRRRAASSRRTARCGRRTACCSPRAASSRCSRADVTPCGYLGLGSNVGDRRANLQAAVDALPGPRHRACSRRRATYDTDPVGEVLDQPDFLNACVRIETELEPRGAARRLQGDRGASSAATSAGGVRHGPRPIDVDVLLLGELEHASERLTPAARAGHRAALRADPAARARLRAGARRTARGWPTASPRCRWTRASGRAGPPLPLARRT